MFAFCWSRIRSHFWGSGNLRIVIRFSSFIIISSRRSSKISSTFSWEGISPYFWYTSTMALIFFKREKESGYWTCPQSVRILFGNTRSVMDPLYSALPGKRVDGTCISTTVERSYSLHIYRSREYTLLGILALLVRILQNVVFQNEVPFILGSLSCLNSIASPYLMSKSAFRNLDQVPTVDILQVHFFIWNLHRQIVFR